MKILQYFETNLYIHSDNAKGIPYFIMPLNMFIIETEDVRNGSH